MSRQDYYGYALSESGLLVDIKYAQRGQNFYCFDYFGFNPVGKFFFCFECWHTLRIILTRKEYNINDEC